MEQFIIRFLVCNIFLSAIAGLLLLLKHLFRNHLTSRMQYGLCYPFFLLLTIPFLPIHKIQFSQLFVLLNTFRHTSIAQTDVFNIEKTLRIPMSDTADRIQEFGFSITQSIPSYIGIAFGILWLAGILAMAVFFAKSALHLYYIRKSALPLQNPAIRALYQQCMTEQKITKRIPVYSTAFLKSPIITGFFKPCIYLPIHLISDNVTAEIRYILLHELQHYKSKDAFVNVFMNLTGVLYWFNPVIWYLLKEIRTDREVACDCAVLKYLDENAYIDYGNTLIYFAEKISQIPFPFTTGINATMEQMKRRIIHIANYHPISLKRTLKSTVVYLLISAFLLGFVPFLTIQATNSNRFDFHEGGKTISYADFQELFGENQGSFVLYHHSEDSWIIYDKKYATTRLVPASTIKIYSALFALEDGIITPEQSKISWNKQTHRYPAWNSDQTLISAMKESVTWYFQTLDQGIGLEKIQKYIQKIGYGNQSIGQDISYYWGDGSLRISPIEQVELLQKFHSRQLPFSTQNIEAVEHAICLSATDNEAIYGKTGTIEIEGKNACGWFIGFIDNGADSYYFATYIENNTNATGSYAMKLTFSILEKLGL